MLIQTINADPIGLPSLLQDLSALSANRDQTDVVFVLGPQEERVFAHSLILKSRCAHFQRTSDPAPLPHLSGLFADARVISTACNSTDGPPIAVHLPIFQPEIFKQLITYIYTAQVSLTVDSTAELWSLAGVMGLKSLEIQCQTFLAAHMSTDTACAFLTAAGRLETTTASSSTTAVTGRSDGTELSSGLETCLSYICQHARQCLQSTAFRQLTANTVIRIISSDQLTVDAVCVWRAVLAWAKHGAAVSRSTEQWSEQERIRVRDRLSDVISHVNLLLIDSRVYAEEVEPTGCVPRSLTLERYRSAALSDGIATNIGRHHRQESQSSALPPSVPQSLQLRRETVETAGSRTHSVQQLPFRGSQLLAGTAVNAAAGDAGGTEGSCSASWQLQLVRWAGGDGGQPWRLVFRASEHQHSARSFHRLCDGIAPLYVVCQGESGDVCGGYTDVAWTNSGGKGRFIQSDRSFLFTLNNRERVAPCRFPVSKRMYAICYHTQCGPVFGAGADLYIADSCNSSSDSYSNLPHSYDGCNASCSLLFGSYNFTVADYEVFTPELGPVEHPDS